MYKAESKPSDEGSGNRTNPDNSDTTTTNLATEELRVLLCRMPSEEKRVEAAKRLLKSVEEKDSQDKADKIAEQKAKLTEHKARVKQEPRVYYSSDCESDDDIPLDDGEIIMYNYEGDAKRYGKLIMALPYSPMLLAFHALPSETVTCLCPCSKSSKEWQIERIGSEIRNEEYPCDKSKAVQLHGLVDHLKAFSNKCKYHDLALEYLNILYRNFWPNPKLSHKALYKPGDENYRRAEAEQRKAEFTLIHQLQAETLRNKQKVDELEAKNKLFEEAAKVSPHIHGLQKKQADFRTIMEKLSDEKSSRTVGSELLTETKKEQYRNQYEVWVDYMLNLKFEVAKHQKRVKIAMDIEDGEFDLLKYFTSCYVNMPRDQTFLFHDIDMAEASALVVQWNVEVKSSFLLGIRRNKKQRTYDNIQAVDESGPTREFLSEVWKQIGQLKVTTKCGEVKLFDDMSGTFILPTIEGLLPKDEEGCRMACSFYVAVGRIMASCIGRQIAIPSHVLPDFYKNYLLRGISPMDVEYPIVDLVIHVWELLSCASLLEQDGKHQQDLRSHEWVMAKVLELWSEDDESNSDVDAQRKLEEQFRNCIYQEFVANRDTALTCLAEGLNLSGFWEPKHHFCTVPIDAINYMMFCQPNFAAMDIIDALCLEKYDDTFGDDSVRYQKMVFSGPQKQQGVREQEEPQGILVDILKEANNDFCRDFFWFVTGYSYMPQAGFQIVVEFNGDELPDAAALPVSHTCVMTIKFPALAYEGNKQLLKRQLQQSLDMVRSIRFDMA